MYEMSALSNSSCKPMCHSQYILLCKMYKLRGKPWTRHFTSHYTVIESVSLARFSFQNDSSHSHNHYSCSVVCDFQCDNTCDPNASFIGSRILEDRMKTWQDRRNPITSKMVGLAQMTRKIHRGKAKIFTQVAYRHAIYTYMH